MSDRQVYFGTVIWFNRKGIGFIRPDEAGSDLFCHYSNIVMEGFKTLHAGERVSYTIGANKNGPQAEEIKVISKPE